MNIIEYHRAVKSLEFMLDLDCYNVDYKIGYNPPSTYKSMVRSYNQHNYFIVFEGGCDSTIFSNKEYNYLFRAIHDKVHYDNKLTFSLKDERSVALIQAKDFYKRSKPFFNKKIRYNIYKLIICEIKGQIEYYQRFNKYVDNQKEFTKIFLNVINK